MNYGYSARIHAMKVAPWTLRLKVANDELACALHAKDPERIVAAVADSNWWTGRLTGDVIPAAGQAGMLSRRDLLAAMRQVLRSHRLTELAI